MLRDRQQRREDAKKEILCGFASWRLRVNKNEGLSKQVSLP
jgi:hypothetical protein